MSASLSFSFASNTHPNELAAGGEDIPWHRIYGFSDIVKRNKLGTWKMIPNCLNQFREIIRVWCPIKLFLIPSEQIYLVSPYHVMAFAAAFAPDRRIEAEAPALIAIKPPGWTRARIQIDRKVLTAAAGARNDQQAGPSSFNKNRVSGFFQMDGRLASIGNSASKSYALYGFHGCPLVVLGTAGGA
jgi:hypothetical protein